MYIIAILLILSLLVMKALTKYLKTREPNPLPIRLKQETREPNPLPPKLKQEIQRLKKIELQKMQDDERLHSYMRLDMKRTLNNPEFKEYMRLLQEIKESVGL